MPQYGDALRRDQLAEYDIAGLHPSGCAPFQHRPFLACEKIAGLNPCPGSQRKISWKLKGVSRHDTRYRRITGSSRAPLRSRKSAVGLRS